MSSPHVVSFDEFMQETHGALYTQYSTLPEARVGSAQEFEKMREYILAYYAGITPLSTYALGPGQIVDCVPFTQQPALRAQGQGGSPGPAALPEPPSPVQGAAPPHRNAVPVVQVKRCPEGAIPMIRLDLRTLTRFPTLNAFLSKGLGTEGPPPTR